MKNIFKKFLITSLSTVCLLANQANGMDNSKTNPNFGESSLQRSQMTPFVLQLSQILKLDSEQTAGLVSLSEQNPEEFARSFLGTSGFGTSSLSASSMGLSPDEREIKRLISKSADADLFPPLDPFKIMHLINEILVPKYASVLSNRFSKRSLDISEGDFDDVLEFLTKNKSFIMGDLCSPRSMILFLKLITQKPDFNIITHDPHHMNMYGHYYHSPAQTSWMTFSGTKHGQFILKMDWFYNNLKSIIANPQHYHGGIPDQQQVNEKNLATLKSNFNKIFSYPGHEFDAEFDTVEVSQTIENWVNVVHKLVSFELREWEGKYTLLHQLQGSYDLTHKQLSEAQSNQGFYFSGVVKTPYTIGLIQVEKKNKRQALNSSRESLIIIIKPMRKNLTSIIILKMNYHH